MSEPSSFADRILDDLAIHSISDLEHLELIANARDAIVRYRPISGAEARLICDAQQAIITISTNISSTQRQRFNIAHELGHFEMHRHLAHLKLCETDDLNNWELKKQKASIEYQANEFSASLLLPERFFKEFCYIDPSIELIKDLANQFNTSLTATSIRYTHFTDEAVAVVFSTNRVIKWFRASNAFDDLGLFVNVKSSLHPSTNAGKLFTGVTISSRKATMDADYWLKDTYNQQKLDLFEFSVLFPSYNSTLTLLWVEEIDDEDDW